MTPAKYCRLGDRVSAFILKGEQNEWLAGDATIISTDDEHMVLLGWKQKEKCGQLSGWPLNVIAWLNRKNTIPNIADFKFAWWISKDDLVRLAYYDEKQKCVSCGLSAPHYPPNNGTDYLCNICATILSLGD